MHRFGTGSTSYFFPGTGKPSEVGEGEASGTNLNVAWTQGEMGNVEYAAAFSELILPILSSYKPDLVLVSSGFDAAKGDLIGDCSLMPCMYYAMTRSLIETAGIDVPIVIALEGGYNLEVISCCMEAVALALMNEDWDEEGTTIPQDGQNGHDGIKLSESSLSLVGNNACTSHFSTPADFPSKLRERSDLKLKKGRMILSRFWAHGSIQKKQRNRAKSSAIRAINKAKQNILKTRLWKDCIHFADAETKAPTSSIMTRSRQSNTKVDDLDTAMQGLHF